MRLVLFLQFEKVVDQPVGTGWAYSKDLIDELKVDPVQVAQDLGVLLEKVFQLNPKLATKDLYIFGESFGGKQSLLFLLAQK